MKRRNPDPRNTGRSREKKAPIKEQAIEKTRLSSRLATAPAIEDDLRRCTKLPRGDRALLAHHLGERLERVQKANPQVSARQVFISAFGEDEGEKFLKKRKDLLLKQGETPNAQGGKPRLNARGHNYIALAKALASLAPEPFSSPGERDGYAILRLVNGTSFDSGSVAGEMRDLEARRDLAKCCEILVRSVLDRVDMDEYRAAVRRLRYDSSRHSFNDALDISAETLGGVRFSEFAPSALICRLYEPMPARVVRSQLAALKATKDSFDEYDQWNLLVSMWDEDHPFMGKHANSMGVMLDNHEDYLELWDQDPDGEDWWDIAGELNINWGEMCGWENEESCFEDFAGELQIEHEYVYLLRDISVELRFHTGLDQWVACLVVSPYRDIASDTFEDSSWGFNSFMDENVSRDAVSVGESKFETVWWGQASKQNESGRFVRGAQYFLGVEKDEFIKNYPRDLLLAEVSATAFDDSRFKSGRYLMDGDEALNTLLQSTVDCNDREEDFWEPRADTNDGVLTGEAGGIATSAESHTLLSDLLIDMAFCEKSEALPTRLIEDAKRKATRLFEEKASADKAFKEGMDRWK